MPSEVYGIEIKEGGTNRKLRLEREKLGKFEYVYSLRRNKTKLSRHINDVDGIITLIETEV